ncbi:MAG: DUF4912 domain-containing protein [Planctomycetota bacterium]
MSNSTLEPADVQSFQVEFPERAVRGRKRPAATFEPDGIQEDLSAGLIEALSKLHFVGSSGTKTTSSLVAQQIVEPPPLASTYIDRGLPLPETYGLDRLVALVRDPEWVFVYWELSGKTLDRLIQERGADFVDSCAWVMRLYRADEESAADMEINPSAGGWYIHVGRPGKYVFEMALLSPDGEWISLIVSSILGAPYAGVSERIDDVWRLTPEEEAALSGVIQDVMDSNASSSQGGSRSVNSLGSSRVRSSFGVVGVGSSGGFVGGSESRPFLQSSGGIASTATSGSVPGSWHLPGSSGRVPGSAGIPGPGGSGGSGGFGWVIAPTGAQEPVLVRPQIFGTGPNWNEQPNLPEKPSGKTHQPHFKVKLPRIVYKVLIPKQTWPPISSKVALKTVN